MPEQVRPNLIPLRISGEVREILEKRQILDEDIQQVLDYAEKTGRKLLNRQTGHYVAHHKPTKVTYWVEYTPAEGEYIIHNAYCHRMEIGEGEKK